MKGCTVYIYEKYDLGGTNKFKATYSNCEEAQEYFLSLCNDNIKDKLYQKPEIASKTTFKAYRTNDCKAHCCELGFISIKIRKSKED